MRKPLRLSAGSYAAWWRRADRQLSHHWLRWRQLRRQRRVLKQVRAGLTLRGAAVEQLSDAELLDLIGAGRRMLGRAGVRGGDITAAYVMLVRRRERL